MRNVLIMGAAGKDFHVFNTCYRDDPDARVIAFTATQIPNIDGRRYPPQLAGPRYPEGIGIHPESQLAELVRARKIDDVVFAYSDVSYDYVAGRRALAEGAGARFHLADPDRTMIPSARPVVAVCAVRTGCGKSQTTRKVAQILRARGKRVVVVRHPMPYGDLVAQEVQRFATLDDLERHRCTIEEMEEYEPHLRSGSVVYAGIDYAKILARAEAEADVILWDGGNNDTPFYRPTLHLVVADPHRAGHEVTYHPGRVNFERAHVIVINKIGTATPEGIATVCANAARMNPRAVVIRADSPVTADRPELIAGRRVLVIEDGPTTTHGDMTFGAGTLAARRHGAKEIVDPRPFAVGSIADTFRKYPKTGPLLPAMGYDDHQVRDLEATINACDCDAVVVGTPVNLSRFLRIEKPVVRVTYELAEIGKPDLVDVLARI